MYRTFIRKSEMGDADHESRLLIGHSIHVVGREYRSLWKYSWMAGRSNIVMRTREFDAVLLWHACIDGTQVDITVPSITNVGPILAEVQADGVGVAKIS